MVRVLRFIGVLLLLCLLRQGCKAQETSSSLYLAKVAYAKSIGLDTLSEVTEKLELYKRGLLFSSFADAYLQETVVRSQSSEEVVVIRQIFKKTPQNITASRLTSLQQQMDSIYRQLQKGASFQEMVQAFSDSKEEIVVRKLQMPVEFEDIAFRLKDGEISAPFTSPLGIHIIQVVSHKVVGSSADDVWEIRRLLESGQDPSLLRLLTETLKEEFHFQQNEENCKDLMRRGESDRVLFVLDGKEFTGTDFARYYATDYGTISTRLDRFVTKCLLDTKIEHLKQDPEVYMAKQESFLNDMLVEEATLREVIRPSEDELALKSYFDTHQDEFRWPTDRYKGILIQAPTKKMAKQAAKLLKKKPYEEWEALLAQRYQKDGILSLTYKKGVFAAGDDAYVDDLVFKGPHVDPNPSYPYAAVQGKKVKGPDNYEAVPREMLVAHFQDFLENQWEKRLKSLK